jgi:hypothetical protein
MLKLFHFIVCSTQLRSVYRKGPRSRTFFYVPSVLVIFRIVWHFLEENKNKDNILSDNLFSVNVGPSANNMLSVFIW